MTATGYSFVFLGLSITSSWGNGHATTYRGLLRQLALRGHRVLFLERDLPFYRENRDLPNPPYGAVELYDSVRELRQRFEGVVREADLVVVGSYVPDGIEVIRWVTEVACGHCAFYDIDTPVTLKRLREGNGEYIRLDQVQRFDLYLSFTGGPTLQRLQDRYGAKRARALYCSVDPELYRETDAEPRWDLGYLGTYSDDRQPALESLLLEPARRCRESTFVVAGPLYPKALRWPPNVERIEHLSPDHHADFYSQQRYTLNITRRPMVVAGYSPSVRLFEAAACATPIISDIWPGIETFFEPGREILLATSTDDVLRYLRDVPEEERIAIGRRARERALAEHTASHRAGALEELTRELLLEKGYGDTCARIRRAAPTL